MNAGAARLNFEHVRKGEKPDEVNWNENACCHSGNCVRSLPEVFAVENGRFVSRPDKAPEERVREIVAACPGQALTIEET